MKTKSGFTLIEMIIVVVIIGILATVAVIKYEDLTDVGRAVEARSILYRAYAGYQKLMIDGEQINATNQLTWARMALVNPNTLSDRHFEYYISPDGINPNRIEAARRYRNGTIDSTKWLSIDLSTGNLTKSLPF